MTTLNRKISRGIVGFENNQLVIEYYKKYKFGKGLIFKIITEFGDSDYSNKFCEYIKSKINSEKLSNYTFSELLRMFETNDSKIIIENRLNYDC